MTGAAIIVGDALEVLRTLPDESVHACVTSPPYWKLRDYGVEGQLGLESTVAEYVESLVAVFEEVRRVLVPEGTLWLNLGDSYVAQKGGDPYSGLNSRWNHHWKGPKQDLTNGQFPIDSSRKVQGLKRKDLIGVPWRVAFALQDAGWWLRMDVIWAKPNPKPESTKDRPARAHEYVFMLTKSERCYYDEPAVRQPYAASTLKQVNKAYNGQATKDYAAANAEDPSDTKRRVVESLKRGGANLRSVWTIATQPFHGAHFAVFPEALPDLCIRASCPVDGIVLDPFAGAGTTGLVAMRLGRGFLGIELNPDNVVLAHERLGGCEVLT